MSVYKRMYLHLFNAVTDALNALGKNNRARAVFLLTQAQINCEDLLLGLDVPEEPADPDTEPLPTEDPGIDVYDFLDFL